MRLSGDRTRFGNSEEKSGIGARLTIVLVCSILACLPVEAQLLDKAGWDVAHRNRYGDQAPFLDGPWFDFGDPDPDGVFGDVFAFSGHHMLRAYYSMAHAYGDTSYLDLAVTLIEEMLHQRDDRRVERGELNIQARPYVYAPPYYLQPENRNKGAKGWRRTHDNQIRIEALSDGLICDAIMRFVDLVTGQDRFTAYRTNVSRYIADCEDTVAMHDDNFMFNRQGVAGIYYYSNPDGSGLYSGSLPLNHNFVILRAGMLLDKHRGNEIHRPKAEAFLQYFWTKVTLTEGRYVWDYDPRGQTSSKEDINHGAIDIASLVLGFDRGLVDATHMQRLARTFTGNLYRGNGDTAHFVDGSGSEFKSFDAAIGWIELSRFDPAIWSMAAEVLLEDYPVPTWSDPFLAWAEILRYASGVGELDAPDNLRRDH